MSPMEQRPEIKRENVKTLFESPYLRVAKSPP